MLSLKMLFHQDHKYQWPMAVCVFTESFVDNMQNWPMMCWCSLSYVVAEGTCAGLTMFS